MFQIPTCTQNASMYDICHLDLLCLYPSICSFSYIPLESGHFFPTRPAASGIPTKQQAKKKQKKHRK